MDKNKALREYFDVDIVEKVGENEFEVDGETYVVYDESERDDAVYDYMQSLLDDVGFSGFTPNFKDWIFMNAIDDDFKDNLAMEIYESHYIDMDDEEVIDYAIEHGAINSEDEVDDVYELRNELTRLTLEEVGADDLILDELSIDEALDIAYKNNAYDLSAIVDESIDWDGYGHFLSPYDGEEIELDGDYYAYRVD